MKNIHKLSLVAALAMGFMTVNQVKADDSLLPPRAKELFSKKMAAEADTGPNLVKTQLTGPAAKVQALRPTVIAGTGSEPSTIQRPLYTGKNPFQDSRGAQFQVAPLAKPGKECKPGCAMPCCEKK